MSKKYNTDSKVSYGKPDFESFEETLPWKSFKKSCFISPKKTKSKNP